MNRKYTKEEILKTVKKLRDNFKDVILTADIIVGFPGETEKEFEETYELLKKIKLYKIHVFPYSKREGTRAAEFENQISSEIKEKRSKKIIELSDNIRKKYNKNYIGKKIKVLVEEKIEQTYIGHTANYMYVEINNSKRNIKNEIVNVTVIGINGDRLIGEI